MLRLVVEQQTVFGTTGQHVQRITHLPEKFLGGRQQRVFALQQKALVGQCVQIQRAVLATGNPEDGLNIAQPAGRAFDVGLEVVFGVVVLVVAVLLLGALGQEELLARPHVRGCW